MAQCWVSLKCFCGRMSRLPLSLASSATNTDQWQDSTRRKNGLLNICVYPQAKTNMLYLPQSNMPYARRLKGEKKNFSSATQALLIPCPGPLAAFFFGHLHAERESLIHSRPREEPQISKQRLRGEVTSARDET